MKVRNIDNTALSRGRNNNVQGSKAPSSNPSFTGATDLLIKFWEGVERGGLAASFTIQDNLGTNIPRTWGARKVGKEYTGKNNWTAVLENGLREFLTGPSMFAVPAAVLYGTMRHFGKANGVPVQSIKDFSEILIDKEVDISSRTAFKESFYSSVLDRAFNNFDNLQKPIDSKAYAKKIIKMEYASKKGFFKNIAGKQVENSREDLLQEIINSFVKDKKANTKGYPDFLSALITNVSDPKKAGKYEIQIDDLIGRMGKYADDMYSTILKTRNDELTKEFIENFANKRMGGRFVTNIAMGVFTAAAMWFIPKIYTIGKTNPETDPVRKKANELKSDLKTTPAPSEENKKGEVNFTGGGISKIASDLGKKVAPNGDGVLSKLAPKLESNWINVARPMFYVLITGFTLVPRLIQSTKRDIESSKKNGGPVQWDETSNILRRDVTTILTILFAMEGLGSLMAHRASKNKGIVLTNKILDNKTGFFKKCANFLNPDGGVQVLSKKQNTAQMSNFANMDELMRFFRDEEKKTGGIYKLLHIDANSKKGENALFYNALKKVFGSVVDKKDIKVDDLQKVLDKAGDNLNKDAVGELLGVLNDTEKNPLLRFGNKINAIFQTLSLAIVTSFLGYGLPKINELVIKRKYLKDNDTLQTKYQDPDMQIPAYSLLNNLKPFEKETYQYFLGKMK